MAYSSDITALNPSHHFKFDGDATDSVGSLSSTDTSMVWTGNSICNDATYCMKSNAVDDLLELDTSSAINTESDRILVAGWFEVTEIQQPPTRIYGDGGASSSLAFHLGFGNQVLFEVDSDDFTLQIIGDIPLIPNRPYHLAIRFESDSYGNVFKAYLDGVNQTDTTDNTPGSSLAASRTKGSFGGKDSGLSLGGTALKIVSPVNGKYNHWAFWHDSDATNVSDSEIRTELFEKGAKPDITISSDTEENMQNAIDGYSDSVRGNHPLCILIEEVSGGGDLSLDFDNITFNDKASLHVRYLGSGTLTITNSNGSNASIVTSNITIINPHTLTLTNLKNNTEVRVYEAGTTTEIIGQENVTSGTFSGIVTVDSVDIRVVSLDYRIFTFYSVDTSSSKTINVEQFFDKNYRNS